MPSSGSAPSGTQPGMPSGMPRSATPHPGAGPVRDGGYGNIYTPHAGSMIIQVQRESGLQSRTIVLSARQIRILRFIMSRMGKLVAAGVAAIAVLLIVEAARVPALTGRISRMEHTAQRLDTLERSLSQLQKRYDQVRTMMGGDAPADGEHTAGAATGFIPAPAIQTRAPGHAAARAALRATVTDAPADGVHTAGAATGFIPAPAIQTRAPGHAAARAALRATVTDAPSDGGDAPADSEGAATPAGTGGASATPAAHRGRARGAATTAAPQSVVVPPPPDSGTAPSPQAEPQ